MYKIFKTTEETDINSQRIQVPKHLLPEFSLKITYRRIDFQLFKSIRKYSIRWFITDAFLSFGNSFGLNELEGS